MRSSIAGGADLVLFSGDKLLGGPQAGIVAGRERLVALVRKHPLMRALRADKMTYAALEATLHEHAAGRAAGAIPVSRMIDATPAEIESRASRIAAVPRSRLTISLVEGASTIGGGSAPGSALPTPLLAVSRRDVPAAQLEARLRAGTPPIIARIEEAKVLLDLRTVLPEQDEAIAAAISALDA